LDINSGVQEKQADAKARRATYMVMKTVDTARSDDGLSVLLDFSGQEIWALEILFFFGVLAKLVEL
jgi:hypothetical protein